MWPLLAQASPNDSIRNLFGDFAELSSIFAAVLILVAIRVGIHFLTRREASENSKAQPALRQISIGLGVLVYLVVFVFMVARPFELVIWPLLSHQDTGDGFRKVVDDLARTPLSDILKFVLILSVLRIDIYFAQQDVPAHKRSGLYGVGSMGTEMFDALVYAAVFVFMVIRPFFVQAFLIPSGSMVQTLQVNDFIVANKMIYRYSDPKEGDIVVFRPPKRAIFDASQIDNDGNVNVDFIKRCIGVPGDVIEIKDNVLYRNGVKVDEPYKAFTTPDPPFQQTFFRNLTPDEVKQEPEIDFKLVKYQGQYWPVNMEVEHGKYTLVNWEVGRVVAQDYLAPDVQTMDALKNLPPAPVPKGYYLMMGDNRFGSFDSRGWGLVPRDAIIGRSEFIWLPFAHWGRTRSDHGTPVQKN